MMYCTACICTEKQLNETEILKHQERVKYYEWDKKTCHDVLDMR